MINAFHIATTSCISCNRLLTKKRNAMGADFVQHSWNKYEEEDIEIAQQIYDRAIFPMHNIVPLVEPNFETNQFLRQQCAELHSIARMYVYFCFHFEFKKKREARTDNKLINKCIAGLGTYRDPSSVSCARWKLKIYRHFAYI